MFDDLLSANAGYASNFGLRDLTGRAARHFSVVTCMDTRIEPLPALGLVPGDAKILRNAGGRVTPDVLRSLMLATSMLGVTRVAVMHHTRCALAGTDQAGVTATFTDEQRGHTQGWEFLAMPDPDTALAADVAAIRACAALPPELEVEGWRYDVDTGVVRQVVS